MTRFLALLILLLPAFALAAELKVATWNLDWLTTREAGDRFLPPTSRPARPRISTAWRATRTI
jgi:hypothetical protein